MNTTGGIFLAKVYVDTWKVAAQSKKYHTGRANLKTFGYGQSPRNDIQLGHFLA
ncbi:MAG: hypothetical protein HY376_02725 [Candidatus Blackburnbacteria bacterium]|nr:hypothetical protein [Candidatus Blackburnbacteria bacterium]